MCFSYIFLNGDIGNFTRPWQSEVPPFTASVEKNVFYPCNEEDHGMVYIGWRGPSAITQREDLSACVLLLKYLTDTSASPLQKEFVEIEGSYASDVKFSLSENSVSMLYLAFQNVPKSKISKIAGRLNTILKQIVSNKNGIDMARMNIVIHRHILETLSILESKPHDSVAYMIIGDFLFGNTTEDVSILCTLFIHLFFFIIF